MTQPQDSLKHTEYIQKQLRVGHKKQAADAHNKRVAAELRRAEAGETICLSDLMAAKDELTIDSL